jgi:alanine transaminase
VNPPYEKNASPGTVKRHNQEIQAIRDDLKAKALIMTRKLNAIPNVKCQEIEGAMYAFPRIYFPKKFEELAQSKQMEADLLFCLEMLEEKGIVCVQEKGTHHFRLTNLICPKEKLEQSLDVVKDFTVKFLEKYS